MIDFVNDAQPISPQRRESYGFSQAPTLLVTWGALFQAVVSQAGTYLLHKKFHDGPCGIYKSEGGCNIVGHGELVLLRDMCYWNRLGHPDCDLERMIALITDIVVHWNPNDPIESMLTIAANHVGTTTNELRDAIARGSHGGPFGGNSLSSFFGYNPFEKPHAIRSYLRFCLVNISGMTEADVDQQFSDEDLGDRLLARIRETVTTDGPMPSCCSPRRSKDGTLMFWVGTGSRSELDGWHTEEALEAFLASGRKLVRTP